MCYSEFNDIIDAIAAMDADVISIETARSDMELLEAFAAFAYPNEIGPGVWDIHSPRVPDAGRDGRAAAPCGGPHPARAALAQPRLRLQDARLGGGAAGGGEPGRRRAAAAGRARLTALPPPSGRARPRSGVEGLARGRHFDHCARPPWPGCPPMGWTASPPTARGLLLDAQKGFAFVVDCTQAKEFALAHWLVNGADGGRLFVRCFGGDGRVRENAAGDVLASLTTMVWNAPSKSWTGGATWPTPRSTAA